MDHSSQSPEECFCNESSLRPQTVEWLIQPHPICPIPWPSQREDSLPICLYTTREGDGEGGNYSEMRMNPFPAFSSYNFTLYFPQQILPLHVYRAYVSALTPSFVKYKVVFCKTPFKQFIRSPVYLSSGKCKLLGLEY